MTTAIDTLVVEVAPGERIRCSWEDNAHTYHFTAACEGDSLGAIMKSGLRDHPVVYRRDKAGGRHAGSYDSPSQYEAEIAAIRQRVLVEGLATKAREVHAASLVERAYVNTKAKADAIRELMARHGIVCAPEVSDASLAAFFNDVQDSMAGGG